MARLLASWEVCVCTVWQFSCIGGSGGWQFSWFELSLVILLWRPPIEPILVLLTAEQWTSVELETRATNRPVTSACAKYMQWDKLPLFNLVILRWAAEVCRRPVLLLSPMSLKRGVITTRLISWRLSHGSSNPLQRVMELAEGNLKVNVHKTDHCYILWTSSIACRQRELPTKRSISTGRSRNQLPTSSVVAFFSQVPFEHEDPSTRGRTK